MHKSLSLKYEPTSEPLDISEPLAGNPHPGYRRQQDADAAIGHEPFDAATGYEPFHSAADNEPFRFFWFGALWLISTVVLKHNEHRSVKFPALHSQGSRSPSGSDDGRGEKESWVERFDRYPPSLQGYLANKKCPTPRDPTVRLCLGSWARYGRDTPVG